MTSSTDIEIEVDKEKLSTNQNAKKDATSENAEPMLHKSTIHPDKLSKIKTKIKNKELKILGSAKERLASAQNIAIKITE